MCHLCNLNGIGDGFSYIFKCNDPVILNVGKYNKHPNIFSYSELFNCTNMFVLKTLCLLI